MMFEPAVKSALSMFDTAKIDPLASIRPENGLSPFTIGSSAPKMLMFAPESAIKFGPRKLMFAAWSPPDPAPNRIRFELLKSKVNKLGLMKLMVLAFATIELRLVGQPPLVSKMLGAESDESQIVP